MTPFFSIIIPLYNKEKYISNTLKSVLDQTFEAFEVIVVNDGSTDSSETEARQIKDHRIKIFSIENQGVSHARNFGIKMSNADYIAFLDADDWWYPNHLKDIKYLIDKFPDCGLYAKAYENVYFERNTFKAKFLDLNDSHLGIVKDYFHHSLINQIAWTSAVAIPKNILNSYGNFDTRLRTGEDTDLWTRIALHEKVAFDAKVSAQKIINESKNHLSQSSHTLDKVLLISKFTEQEETNVNFKKYMDYNRYAIAIERKMAGDNENFRLIKDKINSESLNSKQMLLLKMPKTVLMSLKWLQGYLLKHRIYLSAFR